MGSAYTVLGFPMGPRRGFLATSVFVWLVVSASSASPATIIPNRTTLNGLLGSSARTENFDAIDIGGVPSWTIAAPGQPVDSSTHAIIEGVSFTSFCTYLTVRESGTGQRIEVGNQFPASLVIDFSG
jgi:hypothetical protein